VVQSFDVCIGRQPAVVVEQLATSIAGGAGATPLGPRSRLGCRTRGGGEDEDRQQGGREPAHRDRNAPAWRLIYVCLPPRRVPTSARVKCEASWSLAVERCSRRLRSAADAVEHGAVG